jgi:ketosteroid isomerase-like protein
MVHGKVAFSIKETSINGHGKVAFSIKETRLNGSWEGSILHKRDKY